MQVASDRFRGVARTCGSVPYLRLYKLRIFRWQHWSCEAADQTVQACAHRLSPDGDGDVCRQPRRVIEFRSDTAVWRRLDAREPEIGECVSAWHVATANRRPSLCHPVPLCQTRHHQPGSGYHHPMRILHRREHFMSLCLQPSGRRRRPAVLVERNSQPNCHLANGVRRSVHEVCLRLGNQDCIGVTPAGFFSGNRVRTEAPN
jgi:hypothetical protein